MKKYSRPFIFLLFIALSISLEAQLNYKNGYIITLNNDTLFGLVNDGGGIRNSKVCLFKADKKSKTVKYYPKDIKAFRFIGEKYYRAKKLFHKGEFRYVFIDVLLEGELNLYYDRKSKDMEYYIERKGGELVGLLNKELSVVGQSQVGHIYYGNYINSVMINVYKDTLRSIFASSSKIQNQVDNVEYNPKAIIGITKAFLDETCTGIDCIRFEKDLTTNRESFGVFTGVQFSYIAFWESMIKDSEDMPLYALKSGVKSDVFMSVPVGFFYNIPLQLINDKLSFQLEMLTSAMNYKEGSVRLSNPDTNILVNSRMVGIPLLFKYQITNSKLSPSIAIGKQTSIVVDSRERMLHKTQRGGWFFETGLNYKVAPKFSIFANLRFQSNYTLMIADDGNNNRLTYSTAVGNKAYDHRFKTNYAALYFGFKF